MDQLIDFHFFLNGKIVETRSFSSMHYGWEFCDQAGYDTYCDVESYDYMVANGTWRD